MQGTPEAPRQDPADGDRGHVQAASRSASSRRRPSARESLSAGEVGFIIAGIKEIHAAKVGDTVTLAPRPAAAALPGIQGRQAAGVRGALPGRVEPVRGAARRARQAQAQRRIAALRAGGLAGAGLRLPLRLPRPPAHGHRAGAARARVRHGPDHDGADRRLSGAAARRDADRDRESVEAARPLARRGDPRADHHGDDPDAAGIRRPGDDAVHENDAGRRRTCSISAAR